MIVGDLPTRRRTQQTPPPDRKGGQLRLIALILGVVLSFAVIGQRLFVLQIQQQADSVKRIEDRSTFPRYIPATRGLIYDRDGVALVRNAPSYQIAILPYKLPTENSSIQQRIERTALYNRLTQMIDQPGVTAGDIFTRVLKAQKNQQTYQPVVVAENVPREKALIIQELSYQMPGVIVQPAGSRVYPFGPLLSHILGYTNKIPAEAAKDKYPAPIYDIENDRVGGAGIEKIAEANLRGSKGLDEEIRDVAGEVKGHVGTPISPTNGNSVYLTIDLRLQKIISDALLPIMEVRGSPRGAVVALNPQTGEILGMVSVPSFDDNLWTKGAPTIEEYRVISDTLHKPLSNHATQDTVPPGSTFKVISAIALLEEGYVTPETVINDPGVFELPDSTDKRKFYCWIGLRGGSHGNQRLTDALRNSCNTYFRKAVGGYSPENINGMGEDLLAQWAKVFGIGEENDVKLAYLAGDVPTVNQFERTKGRRWFLGDTYNAAIGQGEVQATPLEMANVIASIGNGGTLYQPQIIKEVRDPSGKVIQPFAPKVIRQLPVTPEHMALVRQSLRDVVNIAKNGTAFQSSLEPFGFEFSGKTGTAEFCDDIAQKINICYPGIKVQPTHAWFVAYAPAENPTLALAVYIWNGGQGSQVAAPVAQRIINQYFKLGVPEDKLMPVVKDNGVSE